MVKDIKSGECFRLDHLIKAQLEKVAADKKATAETKADCEDIVVKVHTSYFRLKGAKINYLPQ
jgi:glycyl-tRNA synthetase